MDSSQKRITAENRSAPPRNRDNTTDKLAGSGLTRLADRLVGPRLTIFPNPFYPQTPFMAAVTSLDVWYNCGYIIYLLNYPGWI